MRDDHVGGIRRGKEDMDEERKDVNEQPGTERHTQVSQTHKSYHHFYQECRLLGI